MSRIRIGIIAAFLYATMATFYVATLPTTEACYASGRGVDILHRHCVSAGAAPVPIRTAGVQRAIGVGVLLLLFGMLGRPLLRHRRSRTRPTG